IAVEVRHADVRHHDVRVPLVEQLQRLAGARRAALGETAALEDCGQDFSRFCVVFHYQYSDSGTHPPAGAARHHARRHPASECRLGRQRQPYRKRRPMSNAFAPRVRGPSVQLDDMAHDRKTKPQAHVPARARAVSLPETIEDVRQELLRDALAGIPDPDPGGIAVPVDDHVDAATTHGELYRVRDEIEDHLLEAPTVAYDGQAR